MGLQSVGPARFYSNQEWWLTYVPHVSLLVKLFVCLFGLATVGIRSLNAEVFYFVFKRIQSLCRSANKTWYFFHITFQSDSHFFTLLNWYLKTEGYKLFVLSLCQLKQKQIWAISKLRETIQRDFTWLLTMEKYFLFYVLHVWSPVSGRHSKQMSTISNPTIPGWWLSMHLYWYVAIASRVDFRSNLPLVYTVCWIVSGLAWVI